MSYNFLQSQLFLCGYLRSFFYKNKHLYSIFYLFCAFYFVQFASLVLCLKNTSFFYNPQR
jgi:hypothetical protein